MKYEELVQECKRLRHDAERSEARFLLFLMSAENEHAEVWREAGCSAFEQFLRSNDLCEVNRYLNFCRGVARSSPSQAQENGAHWTVRLGMFREEPSPAISDELAKRAAAFVQVNQTAPSDQTVRKWVHELQPKASENASVKAASELAKLREENRVLKAENKALTSRVAELETELGKRKAA